MRTPRYLPGVRNGVVAKRQGRNSRRPSISMGRASRVIRAGARRGRRSEERGGKVMWLMILTGVALAAGFVFALRSQINAYRIAQAEEQLKSQLDEYARRQKFLTLDQQRAVSDGGNDRAERYGLDHLKLEKESPAPGASAQKNVHAPPLKPRPNAQEANRTVKAAPQAKAPKLVKSVKAGKSAKVVKAVKLKTTNKTKADNKKRR